MANVLIIDDDIDVTQLLETHLRDEGHTVTVTHDCKSATAHLSKSVPDLIMLDVFLPDATGYQMCNQIRKNEHTKTTPIIMMTGAAKFPNQQMYGRQRGANEYIFKPFNIVEVGDLVHKYIAPTDKANQGHTNGTSDPSDQLEALSSFLQRTREKEEGDTPTPGRMTNILPQIPDPVEPLSAFGNLTPDPKTPAFTAEDELTPMFSEPLMPPPIASPVKIPSAAPKAAVARSSEGFVPPTLSAKERFLEFGLDIFALATRLCSTHAEQHLADQLLRTALGLGVKLQAAHFASTQEEFMLEAQGALHDLREAGYWLMIVRKTGLEKLGKADLEKTCQSLVTLLTAFVTSHPEK